jgi:hypothetical protein
MKKGLWLGAESNRRHVDFQSTALPTELPSRDGADRVVPWGVHYATMSLWGKPRSLAAMLSEALQRNAKHEARLSNISDSICAAIHPKLIRDSSRRSE